MTSCRILIGHWATLQVGYQRTSRSVHSWPLKIGLQSSSQIAAGITHLTSSISYPQIRIPEHRRDEGRIEKESAESMTWIGVGILYNFSELFLHYLDQNDELRSQIIELAHAYLAGAFTDGSDSYKSRYRNLQS
jgi:hypothetical protein